MHIANMHAQYGPWPITVFPKIEAQASISFKLCSRLANFKNIAYSLANRHQRWIFYQMSSEKFLSSQLECGPHGRIYTWAYMGKAQVTLLK